MGGLLHWIGVSAIVGGHAAPSPLFQAIVQLGHCSGVLVQPDGVLTSAHCLDGPIDHVVVAGKPVRVTKCERHPAYEPGQPKHDIGFCRLAEPALTAAIPLDYGPGLALGAPVSLAGFGLSSALARETPLLRVAETSIVGVREDRVDVGTADATACRGDSGGPMLVDRAGHLRVAAVIHGPTAAICGSPTEVVPVSAQREWLANALAAGAIGVVELPKDRLPTAAAFFGTLLVVSVILASIRRARRMRPGLGPC